MKTLTDKIDKVDKAKEQINSPGEKFCKDIIENKQKNDCLNIINSLRQKNPPHFTTFMKNTLPNYLKLNQRLCDGTLSVKDQIIKGKNIMFLALTMLRSEKFGES